MNKKWQYYEENTELAEKISKKYNISLLLAKILVNKGIIEDEQIQIFLNPTRKNFYDPFLLKDMEKAVNRIIAAINNNESIVIYGDYDVDGITSTTVLKKFLEERGMEVYYYIPNRLDEGYGLNKEAIDTIIEKYNSKLLLTVDCGISGIDEVEYLNSKGIDVIITDHHEPLDVLPNAYAVVDPKTEGNTYPFNQLAGVGVVYKLIQAISIKLNLDEKEYLKYLDLVCVGTISDIVPLIDENRVITKLGLKLVEVTKNIGLKTLLQSSGFNQINSNTISFGIAPRINACGRMGFAENALELFLTEDLEKSYELTDKLNEYNKERQEKEKAIFENAIKIIEDNNENEKKAIIIAGKNWHHGVIGIVASKITDIYYKPSILLCIEGDVCKGSGRSIPGIDLHEVLCECSKNLDKYGGHAMAVGLSTNIQKLENFKEDVEKYLSNKDIDVLQQVINIDAIVSLKEIDTNIVKELTALEPFGEANKMPIFLFKNLKIDSIRSLTEGKHLKLTLKDENNIINAIGFNLGKLAEEYQLGDKVDVVGNLEINSFNGYENVQINIRDIMKSL